MGNVEAKHEGNHADGVALMQAAHSGDVSKMDTLLKHNPALMYAHSKDGESVWHFAARGGQVQVLQAFHVVVGDVLQHQKRPDKFMSQVNHAFNTATVTVNAIAQLPSQLNIPMGKDVSINAPTRQGITPLMAAVQGGKVEAVQFLLAHGADAWKADARGNVALHHAAARTDAACLSALIVHADKLEAPDLMASDRMVNAHNNAGLTPMHFAAWSGAGDCLKLLVNHGGLFLVATSGDSLGDINCNAGSTPLHLAAMKGDLSTIRLLLRAYSKLCEMERERGGAAVPPDPRSIKDRYGKTPRDIANDIKRPDVAEVLEPHQSLEAAVKAASKAAGCGAPRSKVQHSGSMRSQSAAVAEPEHTAAAPAARASNDGEHGHPSGTGRSTDAAAFAAAAPSGAKPAASAHARDDAVAAAAESSSASITASSRDEPAPAPAAAVPVPSGPEVPEELLCPLTNELMKDPVRAADGLAYERSAIEVWFELGNTSFPGGHTRINHTRLTLDDALHAKIAAWMVQNGA